MRRSPVSITHIVCVLAFAGLLFFFIPATLFKDTDKVIWNNCHLRLVLLRQAVITYRTQVGNYPARLSELVREYANEDQLFCPKSLKEGKRVQFKYYLPASNATNSELLLSTPFANYRSNHVFFYLGIRIDGMVVCGTNLMTLSNGLLTRPNK